jgi:predicted acetyltransferase
MEKFKLEKPALEYKNQANKINLYLGLLECQKHGLKNVMLACTKENLGSSRTMQYFDAELEREIYNNEEGCYEQIYWIDVDLAIENKKNEFEKYIAK